jgi:hypothetical protein
MPDDAWVVITLAVLFMLGNLCPVLARRPDFTFLRARRMRISARKDLSPEKWYEIYFAGERVSFEASWDVCERLGMIVRCEPVRFRPYDPVRATSLRGRWRGWCDVDDIDTLCAGFDDWLDALSTATQAGTGPRDRRKMADVQTVADLIRWVEPFLTKKAKGTGLRDDDIG